MPHCRGCGGHVTKDYQRVYGNNDDEVFKCRNCVEETRLDERKISGIE